MNKHTHLETPETIIEGERVFQIQRSLKRQNGKLFFDDPVDMKVIGDVAKDESMQFVSPKGGPRTTTSRIERITDEGNETYLVETMNSVYRLHIPKKITPVDHTTQYLVDGVRKAAADLWNIIKL